MSVDHHECSWATVPTRVLVGAHVAATALMVGPELAMRRTGSGIVAFELAGTPARAERIINEWGDQGRAAASASLRRDTIYLTTYALLLQRWCQQSGVALERAGWPRIGRLGSAVGRAQLAAGAFDQIENLTLLAVLTGRRGSAPALARRNALAKFGLLVAGFAYLITAQTLLTATTQQTDQPH